MKYYLRTVNSSQPCQPTKETQPLNLYNYKNFPATIFLIVEIDILKPKNNIFCIEKINLKRNVDVMTMLF